MEIAKLRSRITIQQATVQTDTIGNRTNAWVDYWSCAAYSNLASGKEYGAAGQTLDSDKLVFEVRWCERLRDLDSTKFRMSFYAIANLLNEKGIPSFRGKEWSTTVIGAIIRQEKYTGCCMLQKYYTEDCISHKMRKNHGELPMFYVEDTHPAIISKETFYRAQREICTRYGVGMANGTAEKDNLAHRMEGKGYPRRKAYRSEESRRKHAEVYKSRETMKFLHHDFSLFIKCEVCGQNLTGQFRTFADGTRELRWTCGKHNKVPHDTPDTRPRPPHMRDAILKRMVADVLGMEDFDAQAMCQAFSHISALGDILTFHFLDGHEEKRRYIPGKRGYRRKEGMKCREEE